MDQDPERAVADDVESVALAPSQGAPLVESQPAESNQDEGAKQAFYNMMSDWFNHYIWINPAVQQPSNLNNPPPVPVVPPTVDPVRLSRPLVDKIRKYGAQEFRATDDDDAEKAECWLDNTIRVFEELSYTSDECLKCAMSLLRDSAYHWWNTLVSVVSKEQVTWDFFQTEFRKKYISQRFIDQKFKEFLELRQGRMTVTEYERKFVRISRYAQECVSTEAAMCKRFEEGLREDIKLLAGILEIKKFMVLVERACKVEELGKEKRKAEFEAKDFRKRSTGKTSQSAPKKFRDDSNRSKTTARLSIHDRPPMSSPDTSIASVGNTRSNKLECQQCERQHVGECWGKYNNRACYRCGARDHFIRDCPEPVEKDNIQNARPSGTATRGRLPRNTGGRSSIQRGASDTAV
ncbi:hypothetical protein PVK06_016879 [Gossypium arboreum]|uniref:CCHC-type domain-containing protein n=1 Tax=Gossypium arboreum TaxID=29729 RepID=A0ABR0Q1L7_GOSAR|nr:hypothetical protein PVK06_016879 [Gossypium arboreum]